MKLLLTGNIFYSVQIDYANSRSIVRLFHHRKALKSRSSALTYFLTEACLSDALAVEDCFATVSVHCLKTGESFELTNSLAWHAGEQTFTGLEMECQLYQSEGVRFSGYTLYTPENPQFITLVNDYQKIEQLKTRGMVITIADDYSLFFRRKKATYLVA